MRSKHFIVYAKCYQTVECKVSYKFTVQNLIDKDSDYVTIQTDITGEHVHESTNWVLKDQREEIANRINTEHKLTSVDSMT